MPTCQQPFSAIACSFFDMAEAVDAMYQRYVEHGFDESVQEFMGAQLSKLSKQAIKVMMAVTHAPIDSSRTKAELISLLVAACAKGAGNDEPVSERADQQPVEHGDNGDKQGDRDAPPGWAPKVGGDGDDPNGDIQIFVKTPQGKIITLRVAKTDTIADVKSLIRNSEGIPKNQQRFVFAGLILLDGWTLDESNVHDNSTLHLELKADGEHEPYFEIFVRMPSGKTITLLVNSTDTIYNVKSMIRNQEGIPKNLLCLIFADKHLYEDGWTLDKHNVQKDSTLHLELGICGSGKRAKIAGDVGDGKITREECLDDVTFQMEKVGGALLASTSQPIATCARRCIELKDNADRLRKHAYDLFFMMSDDELKNLNSYAGGTGGQQQKTVNVRQLIYSEQLKAMKVLAQEMENAKEFMLLSTQYVILKSYSGEGGRVNWKTVQDDVIEICKTSEVRRRQIVAEALRGGALGGH